MNKDLMREVQQRTKKFPSQYRLCYFGKCPGGIATQDEELRKKLNIEQASQNDCRRLW